MRKFKKISSFLSVLLVLSISVGTFPLSALAQYYTVDSDTGYPTYTYSGEIQAPNSSVLSGLGAVNTYAYTAPLPYNDNFPTPPSFSAGANNNWSTSLSSKTFSIVGSDNVGSYCNVSLFSNSSLGINVSSYDSETGRTTWNTSCSPTVPVATQSGDVQTSEVLPLAIFNEDTLVTRVESVQNNPSNVRVTVGVDSTVEAYGARFQRIDGISDWVGHVTIDSEINRATLSDVEKANDTQLPQGVKIGVSSPSVSRSVERPRNSDIIDPSVTQPKCTQWTDGNSWRTVQHVHCVEYALSADGRTGRADYYDSAASSGPLRALLVTATIALVSWAIGLPTIGSSIIAATDVGVAEILGSATGFGLGSLTDVTGALIAVASGSSVLGTVESTIASSPPYGTEKAWVWTWSELPPPPTVTCTPPQTMNSSGVCAVPVTCPNGANNSPTCSICTAPQTMNSSGVCTNPVTTTVGTVSSLPRSVTVTVCSGNTPTWNGSSCVGIPPVVPPVTPPGGTPLGGTPPGGIPSAGTPSDGNLNGQIGGSQNNQGSGNQNSQGGGQNQGVQGNNGNPSVTISADPNRVQSGNPSKISWTLNNVSCNITRNGTSWKSNVSSSGWDSPTINGRTIFTISCTDSNGESVAPQSVTVNITPLYREF